MSRNSSLLITWKGKDIELPKVVNGHRENYHKTKTELKAMKLCPLDAPIGYGLQQYTGDIFYLYDVRKTEPYKISNEEKERLKIYRIELNKRKICPICNKQYTRLNDIVHEYIPINGNIEKHRSCIACNEALWEKHRRNEEVKDELKMQETRKIKHDFTSYFLNKGIELNVKINDDEVLDIVYLDFETTGLSSDDEVLQVSLIDNKGRVLLYKLCKPKKQVKWDDAMKVNGITPADVENESHFENYVDYLSSMLIRANTIVCYNVQFELKFLNKYGVKYSRDGTTDRFKDPMIYFSEVYGEWNEYYGNYKWQNLTTAARYYNYEFEGQEHNSLADVFATRFVYERMLNDK